MNFKEEFYNLGLFFFVFATKTRPIMRERQYKFKFIRRVYHDHHCRQRGLGCRG